MSNQLDKSEMTEDQVLAYTQNKRIVIVDKLTENGKIPDDKIQASLLTSSLDGLDRSALTRKRISADEKSSQDTAGAAALIARLLMQQGSNRNNVNDSNIIDTVVPELGHEIPSPELVPGETDINPLQMNFETFTSGFQNVSNPSSVTDDD